MSVEKSELKALVYNNLGSDFEDKVEAFTRDLHRTEGAAAALNAAAEKVPFAISAKIKQALEAGEIKDCSALQVAEYAMKQVMKCADFLKHLADVQKAQIPIQGGRIEGLKEAMLMVGKAREDELAKAEAARSIPRAVGENRPIGVAPGPSQASLRKLKAAEDKTAEEKARAEHGTLAERRAKKAPRKKAVKRGQHQG